MLIPLSCSRLAVATIPAFLRPNEISNFLSFMRGRGFESHLTATWLVNLPALAA